MTLPAQTVLDLMALADGELDGDERARVEQMVAESEEARSLVEGFRDRAVSAWLANELDERTASADRIADAVMSKLESGADRADRADLPPGVVHIAARRGPAKSRTPLVVAGLTTVFAAAAAVAIYVRATGGDDVQHASVASVETPGVDMQPPPIPPAMAQARPSQGVEVDEVDSPSRGVSVFEIPLSGGPPAAAQAQGPSSVVIMIEDDPKGP